MASGWEYHHIHISPRASGFGWAITIFSMEWFATLSPELADLDELAVEENTAQDAVCIYQVEECLVFDG